MGKQSTRENKTIYQLCREAAGLTRAEASDKMKAVSDSKIEKFEYETQEPTPYDIIQMADAYKRPDLCNYYCSHKCEIGHRYVPEVEVTDLSNIILETIAGLNEINPLTGRLIQIARDGKISDDEMRDFAFISKKLDAISLAIDSLNLWVDMFGGGFFSTMLKHSKMDHAKQNMDQAKYDLRNFSRELNDVNMACDLHIDTGDFLSFADYFFDGFVVDWMVQDRINTAKRQVEEAIRRTESIVNQLQRM